MKSSYWSEVVTCGVTVMVLGLIVSALFMGEKAQEFNHWGSVALSYFVVGALTHMFYEWMGWNEWYCKHGSACQPCRNNNDEVVILY